MKIRRSFFVSFVRHMLWPFRWYLAGEIAVSIIWAIDISLYSYLVKKIVDAVQCAPAGQVVDRVLPYILMFMGLVCIMTIAFRVYDWLVLIAKPRLEQHITQHVIDRYLASNYQFFQSQLVGRLANTMRDVANGLVKLVEMANEKVIGHVIAVCIAVWTISGTGWQLAVALLVWVAVFALIAWRGAMRLAVLSSHTAATKSRIVGHVVDVVGNMQSVRLFGASEVERNRIAHLTDEGVAAEETQGWYFLKLNALQATTFVLFLMVSLYLLIMGAASGRVTAGDFALVFSITTSLITLLWGLAQDIAKFMQVVGTVNQGLDVIMSATLIQDPPNAVPLVVTKGEIIYDDVYFGYHEKITLFKGLSITIAPGQKVGLVGYSGSGKSTFVNLLLRFFEVNKGRILIDGQNIGNATYESLAQSIAFIPQDPSLFHRTIYENIAYARPGATYEDVIDAAKKAHAHEFIIALHDGYDAPVGERGSKLSGGQRQRIAIARAILKNAPILILDEATSQLDAITERYIQESLEQAMQGKTSLVVAHRLTTLLHMDRILVFDHGEIIEDGTHQELIARDGLYKKLWQHQVGGFLLDDYTRGPDLL